MLEADLVRLAIFPVILAGAIYIWVLVPAYRIIRDSR